MNKFFQKHLFNSFHLFYKLNQTILLVYKTIENFLLCWMFTLYVLLYCQLFPRLSYVYLYILISGKNMHKGLISIIFVNNEIFKILFIKRKLTRHYYFINIDIVYWNMTSILMNFVFWDFSLIRFYNFLSIFIYGFHFFYSYLLK